MSGHHELVPNAIYLTIHLSSQISTTQIEVTDDNSALGVQSRHLVDRI